MSKFGKRIAGWLLALGWALGIIIWPRNVGGPQRDDPERASASREGLFRASLTEANFGMLGFHLFETQDGRKSWNIRSKFAELLRDTNYVFMKSVKAEFNAAKTGNVVTTRSEYGRSYMDTNLVDLEGNVSVKSKRGYLFNMDKMQYDGNKREFLSESLVKMRGPNVAKPKMFLRGIGLRSLIDAEQFKLKRKVKARRLLSTGEWLKIESDRGEFFSDEQRAIFQGNSHSKLPDIEINSEEFELSVHDEKEFLNATGNVRLTHKDRVGRAERAFLAVGSNKIILETDPKDGKATVDVKKNQISGQRIVLHTDDDRVQVESAEGWMTE